MFKIPKKVALKIRQLQLRFFWGGSVNKRSCVSIGWESIEKPKQLGGLGVGNILDHNLALLGKWWWRFSTEPDPLWKRVLCSIENFQGLTASSENFRSSSSQIWRNICGIDKYQAVKDSLAKGLVISIGNGSMLTFWHDAWACQKSLKEEFPRLFSVCTNKNGLVAEMGTWDGEVWVWQIPWRRNLFELEKQLHNSLFARISRKMLEMNSEDRVEWYWSSDKRFSTISCRQLIETEMYNSSIDNSIIRLIWNKSVPPSAQLLLWFLVQNHLKTGDFLHAKGIIGQEDAVCPFCEVAKENSSHIFFTCVRSWNIWMNLSKWWNVNIVIHEAPAQNLMAWGCWAKGRHKKKFWQILFFATIWSIWFARNQAKFEGVAVRWENLLAKIKFRAAEWFKAKYGRLPSSLTQIVYGGNGVGTNTTGV